MTSMTKPNIDLTQAKKALKKYFGYDSFHPTQEEAISAVLAGKDLLAGEYYHHSCVLVQKVRNLNLNTECLVSYSSRF